MGIPVQAPEELGETGLESADRRESACQHPEQPRRRRWKDENEPEAQSELWLLQFL